MRKRTRHANHTPDKTPTLAPVAAPATPPQLRRYALVLATVAALGAGLYLSPAAQAADRWGPGYLIADAQGKPDASHIGAYGPPGAAIPGLAGLAYCADPDLIGPDGSGGYRAPINATSWDSKLTGSAVPAANVERAAYILSAFGQTTRDAQAAGVDAAIYTLLNPATTYALPDGARALQRLGYPNVAPAAKALATQYLANAAEYAGPYTLEVRPGSGAKVGQKTTVALDVVSGTGSRLPGVTLAVSTGAGATTTLTTNGDGTAATEVTPTAAGTLVLKATASSLPGVALRAALPANSGAQRMLLAGGTSAASAQAELKVTTPAGGIRVVKTDAATGKPLAGVRFAIRNSSGATVATGTTTTQGVWEADGLAPGAYLVHEAAAPSGYQLAPDRIATVTDGTISTVTVADARFGGGIRVVKTDAATGKPLAGVRFQVKDAVGAVVASGSTSAEGLWEVDYLPAGTYTVHEVQAANGYQLAADQRTTVASTVVTVSVHDVRIKAAPTPRPRPVTITTLPQTGA